MRRVSFFVLSGCSLFLCIFAAPTVPAQIIGGIEANIQHPFVVGDTTLPPGRYIFRMVQDSNLTAMTVTNAATDTSVEFLVREALDSHIPQRSELVFNRCGNKEFLTKIFEVGTKAGVTVQQSSREEARLEKQGQQPVEHAEEQEH